MVRKYGWVLMAVLSLGASAARADDLGMGCTEDLSKGAKVRIQFEVDGIRAKTTENVTLIYDGKKLSDDATINTIENKEGKVVRYIVKDRGLTFVFSHLQNCGDSMNKPSDYAQVTVTRASRSGEKKVVDHLICSCDID